MVMSLCWVLGCCGAVGSVWPEPWTGPAKLGKEELEQEESRPSCWRPQNKLGNWWEEDLNFFRCFSLLVSPQTSVPWVHFIPSPLSLSQYPALRFGAAVANKVITCVLWEDGLCGGEDGRGDKAQMAPSANLQQQPTPLAATYTSAAASACCFQGYWRNQLLRIPNWRKGDD